MDKGGTSYQNMADDDFPRDITILETVSEIQNEKFQRADTKDGIYNHHNVFFDMTKSPGNVYSCEKVKPQGTIPMYVMSHLKTPVRCLFCRDQLGVTGEMLKYDEFGKWQKTANCHLCHTTIP
jgi:hypothetical protein